jgi:hypothetical protein
MRWTLVALIAGLTSCSAPSPQAALSFIGGSEADVITTFGEPTSRIEANGEILLSYARRSTAFSMNQVQLAPMAAATGLGGNAPAGMNRSQTTLVCHIGFHVVAGRVASVSQSGPGCGV